MIMLVPFLIIIIGLNVDSAGAIEEMIDKHTDKWLSLGPWGALLALFILSIMGMLFVRFRYALYNNGNKKIDKLCDEFNRHDKECIKHKMKMIKEIADIKGDIRVLLDRTKKK